MNAENRQLFLNSSTITHKYPCVLNKGMPNEIEHAYEDLKKKHQLPDFTMVDREFEISSIEKPAFLLRNIRRKISERLDSVTQLLDPLIQPDAGSFVNLSEYRALTEGDRKALLKSFQHVQELYLLCIDAELSTDDAQDVTVIRRAVTEWPVLRQSLRSFVQKIASSWTKSVEHKNDVGYFG